jgi:drug/metabolite transporter (DMT)-like permease
MPRRAWAELLALSALWGSSYLFISIALRDVGPAFLAFVRVAGAAVVLVPLTWRLRSALSGRWRYLPLVGFFQVALPFVLISAGERHIDSGLAGTLVATAPLWLVAIGPAVALGRPSLQAVAGTVVGLVGVAVLLGGIGTGATVDLGGAGMVVAAAMSYAIALALVRRFMTGVHATALTGATMATAAVLLVPPAALDLPSRWPGMAAGGALLTLAVACTAGAFVLFNRLIAEVGPQRASLVAYLAPVFAIGYGAVLLDEPLGIGTIAGLALILGGSWACSRPPRIIPPGGEHEGTVRASKVEAG